MLRRTLGLLVALSTLATVATAQTVMPVPQQMFWNNSAGTVCNGCKLYTYSAGTLNALATYSDVGLSSQNTNPIVLNAAGQNPNGAIFLQAHSYKFILTTSGGTTIWTRDNISAVPTAAGNVDLTGTAGETIAVGACVYLSDGSGGKQSGQWYNCDSANIYSSVAPIVGIATTAIATASPGTIRTHGSISGLTSLSVGAKYYAGTAGALTATAPTNARAVGVADSTTSMIVPAPPAVVTVDLGTCNLRASLSSTVPITKDDVTAATSVYISPVRGGQCAFYDGASTWMTVTAAANVTVSVPASTNTNYDVFCYNNAGALACEASAAWSGDNAIFGSGTYQTTRPTQNTVYVKSTNGTTIDATRRYIASFRTTAVSGQTEDSAAKRYLWNYYVRVPTPLQSPLETTDTWNYTLTPYRPANNNAVVANQFDLLIGVPEVQLTADVVALVIPSAGVPTVAIGEDSTTAAVAGQLMSMSYTTSGTYASVWASLVKSPTIGKHSYVWLESSTATGTTTWYGDNGTPTKVQSGIKGSFQR